MASTPLPIINLKALSAEQKAALAEQLGAILPPVAVAPSPSLGAPFSRAVHMMKKIVDHRFGTTVAARDTPVGKVFRTLDSLKTDYVPLQGEWDPANGDANIGGNGAGTINSEVQRYRETFDARNLVMESDCIRLQGTVEAGTWDAYMRGQIIQGGAGVYVNAPAATSPVATTFAAMGIDENTPGYGKIAVGDICNVGFSGFATITAVDKTAKTMTLEAVTRGYGGKQPSTANYAINFAKIVFLPIRGAVASGERVIPLDRVPLSDIVPGMTLHLVLRGSSASGDPSSTRNAVIESVNRDPVNPSVTLSRSLPGALAAGINAGLLVHPGTWASQLWMKKPIGAQIKGKSGLALRIEAAFPVMPHTPIVNWYTRDDMNAVMNNPLMATVLWGFFPALWLFPIRSTAADGSGKSFTEEEPTGPVYWNEIDIVELFVRAGHGTSAWTGALHTRGYSAELDLVPTPSEPLKARNGGTWAASPSTGPIGTVEELTSNASKLQMLASIADGNKHSFGIFQTRDAIVSYFEDQPIRKAWRPTDTSYPFQLGMNLAMGALNGGGMCNSFFPQNNDNATGQFMKIYSVEAYQQ